MNIMKLVCRMAIFLVVFCVFIMVYHLQSSKIHDEVHHWYNQFSIGGKKQMALQYEEGNKAEVDSDLEKVEKDHVKLNEEWDNFLRMNAEKIKNSGMRKSSLKAGTLKKKKLKNKQSLKMEAERTHFNDQNDHSKVSSVKKSFRNNNERQRAEADKKYIKEDDGIKQEINFIPKTKPKGLKIILIYTKLHNNEDWYNLPKSKTEGYLKRTKCKYSKCMVTYDHNYFPVADAVIFHERDMPSADRMRYLSQEDNRPKSQRWIFFTSETPKNAESGIIPYNGLFNWTMTYKTDSDIYLPYLQYRKLNENDTRPDPNIDYAKSKTRTVAWLIGNCNFGFRLEYARILQSFTNVSVGGGCRDEFKNKINCTRWCDIRVLSDYKFYLSFENGVCTDYITEKYWRYLEMGLVPVVLGGANYSDPRLAIPGSFIDAAKFNTVKELAVYLEYLDKNDSAYNEYFKWKQKYKIWHPPEGDWPFESYFLCKICEVLHKHLPPKMYWKLSDFWNEYADCELPEETLYKKIITSDASWNKHQRLADNKARKDAAKIPVDFDEEF